MCFSKIPSRSVVITKAATVAEIEALAAQYEPMVAQAVNAALQAQADAIDLDALAAALSSGDINAVFTILDQATAAFGGMTNALMDVIFAGGLLGAAQVTKDVGSVVFEFNRLNPKLIDWLKTYNLGLIREIEGKTKEGIRTQLLDGMKAGINPRDQASNIKTIVGLTQRQSAAVANFRRELEGFHEKRTAGGYGLGKKIDRVNGHQVFRPGEDGKPKDGILNRRLRDFRYDGLLANAVKTGKPLTPDQINKMVDAYARKYRKYRAETIARTESLRTTNMGVQEAWRQAVENGTVVEELIRRFWKVAKDERTCPVCKPIPGMNPKGVGLAEPFATPKGAMFLMPAHPDCRCHLFIRVIEPEEKAAYGLA